MGRRQGDSAANRQRSSDHHRQAERRRGAEYGVRGDVFEAIAVTTVADVNKTITEYEDFAAEWQSAQAGVASGQPAGQAEPDGRDLAAETANVFSLGRKAADKAKFNTEHARAWPTRSTRLSTSSTPR